MLSRQASSSTAPCRRAENARFSAPFFWYSCIVEKRETVFPDTLERNRQHAARDRGKPKRISFFSPCRSYWSANTRTVVLVVPVRTPTPSRRRMASRARRTTRTLVCRAGTAHRSTSVAARSPAALALRPPFRSTACVCVNRRFPSLTCVCPEPVLAAGLFFRAMLACISAGALAAAQRRRRHARRPGEARSDHRQHRRDADAHAALLLRRMGRRLMLPADESCGARRGQSADAYRGPAVAYSLRPLRLRHTTRPCSLASELTGRVLAGWLDRAGRRLRFDRDAGVQLHCLGAYLDLRAVISQRTLPPALS